MWHPLQGVCFVFCVLLATIPVGVMMIHDCLPIETIPNHVHQYTLVYGWHLSVGELGPPSDVQPSCVTIYRVAVMWGKWEGVRPSVTDRVVRSGAVAALCVGG